MAQGDQARAILPLLGDKADPRVHDALVRALAIATAKSGEAPSAVALASQTTDPVRRRAMLFEVAQALRP